MLTTCEVVRTGGPSLSDELERGHIVHFPTCPIELPAAEDLEFFRERLPSLLERKNVSFHPEAARVVGAGGSPEERARVERVLRSHADRVQTFLKAAIPSLVPGWTVATTSFRPIEEKGRNLAPHASNELVHVDAGAYGATKGARILRFFVNVNPTEDRVWATKGVFPELFARFGARAGVAGPSAPSLEEGVIDRARGLLVSGLSSLGLPLARVLDSSPYDRAMRRFHNYMKDSQEFRADRETYQEFRFPPFSAWMVLTDGVSHACLSGRFAFVDTFLIPLANCRLPELAPINVLRAGRS